MSGWHWSEFYVTWLRSVVPELGTNPVYIQSFSEIPSWMIASESLAYAESCGDLKMKALLVERGQWQGRGHFIAVSGNWDSMPEAEQRAVLLHELAHSLCGYDSRMQTMKESEFGEFETILLKPGGRDELLSRFDLKPLEDLRESQLSHDARFVRCGLHLWFRAKDEVSLAETQMFGDRYSLGVESMGAAVRALRPEFEMGGRIVDILKSPMPEEFAALFGNE